MKDRTGSTWGGIGIAFGIIIVLAAVAVLAGIFPKDIASNTGTGPTTPPPSNLNTQCSQNPAYTYGAVDKFASGTSIAGTDYIKVGASAPVSSLAAPPAGVGIAYWKSNDSWYCPIKTDNVICGSNLFQEQCIQNGSVTLSVYDRDGRVTLTAGGGANNLSFAANAVHNLELDFQGTAKKAQLPFGGCLVIESNVNVTDVVVSGGGISAGCGFPITYSIGATTNTYKTFNVPAGFDADGVGDLKAINVQLKSGSGDPTLSTTTITFYPANYYIGNDGQFYLGVEKDKNADTTKTATSVATTFIVQ